MDHLAPSRHGMFLTISIALTVIGCSTEGAERQSTDSQAVPVELVEVQSHTFEQSIPGIGTLQARRQVEIRPELDAPIVEVHFEEGQRVAEGDLLFSLDDAKLRRQLQQEKERKDATQTQVTVAQREFERAQALVEDSAISHTEWDNAWRALETAKEEVQRLDETIGLIEERIEDTRLTAPFDGVTSEQLVDQGDYVSRGDLMVTVYEQSPIEVRFTVAERHMDKLNLGQSVSLTVDGYPNETFRGELSFIAPEVHPSTRELAVKATISNTDGRLRPGTFARAELHIDALEDRAAVPEEALVAMRDGYAVFVVEDGRAHRRNVDVGLREVGLAEIRQGVSIGQKVVREGYQALSDGDPVAPRQSASSDQKTSSDPDEPTS